LAIGNKPFLDNYIIDTSAKTPGLVYKLRVKVFNKEGDSLSTNVAFILASVPQKPAKPAFVSDGKEVLITMYQPLDGGSVIVNYEL